MGKPGQKQARKLQATLVRNYDLLARFLTGVRCRATSVAKTQNNRPKKGNHHHICHQWDTQWHTWDIQYLTHIGHIRI